MLLPSTIIISFNSIKQQIQWIHEAKTTFCLCEWDEWIGAAPFNCCAIACCGVSILNQSKATPSTQRSINSKDWFDFTYLLISLCFILIKYFTPYCYNIFLFHFISINETKIKVHSFVFVSWLNYALERQLPKPAFIHSSLRPQAFRCPALPPLGAIPQRTTQSIECLHSVHSIQFKLACFAPFTVWFPAELLNWMIDEWCCCSLLWAEPLALQRP